MTGDPRDPMPNYEEWYGAEGATASTVGHERTIAPVAADDALEPRRRILAECAAKVVPTRPEWLWRRWLARGDVHLLIGKQGLDDQFQGHPWS